MLRTRSRAAASRKAPLRQRSCGWLGAVALLPIGTACISADYRPPELGDHEAEYERTVDRPFDETWQALVDYAASTYFGIENFEKDSGLLTLSFGAENPGDFVDGGYWKARGGNLAQSIDFEGNYVDYATMYLEGRLQARMNIVVRPVNDETTAVRVNTRYVFAVSRQDGSGRHYTETWSFESGGSDTVTIRNPTSGTPKTRTLMPTYKAEKAILEAIEHLPTSGSSRP